MHLFTHSPRVSLYPFLFLSLLQCDFLGWCFSVFFFLLPFVTYHSNILFMFIPNFFLAHHSQQCHSLCLQTFSSLLVQTSCPKLKLVHIFTTNQLSFTCLCFLSSRVLSLCCLTADNRYTQILLIFALASDMYLCRPLVS